MSGKIEIDIKINHEGEVNRYVSGNSMIIVMCVVDHNGMIKITMWKFSPVGSN